MTPQGIYSCHKLSPHPVTAKGPLIVTNYQLLSNNWPLIVTNYHTVDPNRPLITTLVSQWPLQRPIIVTYCQPVIPKWRLVKTNCQQWTVNVTNYHPLIPIDFKSLQFIIQETPNDLQLSLTLIQWLPKQPLMDTSHLSVTCRVTSKSYKMSSSDPQATSNCPELSRNWPLINTKIH